MIAEWFHTEEVQSLGRDGYFRYLGGVAVINAPSGRFARGMLGEGTRGPMDALTWGEEQMLDGLADVIRASNPPGYDLKRAEQNFEGALPFMEEIVSGTFMTRGAQIDSMNTAFDALRPLPVRNGSTYRSICHSNGARLRTITLMGGIQPAAMFMDFMRGPHGRTVGGEGSIGEHRLRLAK